MLFLGFTNTRQATLLRVLGLALIGWTVFDSEHFAVGHGRDVVISVLFVVNSIAWAYWTATAARHSRLLHEARLSWDVYALAAAGGVLLGASPDSAASAFVFVACAGAGIRTDTTTALRVTVLGILAMGISGLLYTDAAITIVAYALGFTATTFAAGGRRESVLRSEQTELLLAQTQRSHEEQVRAARLEESTRIAREIHDVLAHALAGLTIQLEATAALLEQGADRETVLARVHHAHELARDGLRETRLAVGALRGERTATRQRLDQLLAHFGNDAETAPRLTVTGELDRLGADHADTVVRVIQEALTNVRKHAPGAEVSVAVTVEAERVTVLVEDRIAVPATVQAGALADSGGGWGLPGMRERAVALGGTLSAGPTPSGWTVELQLPLGVA